MAEGQKQQEPSTVELFREAAVEVKELVTLEVALARREMTMELEELRAGMIALALAGGAALVTLIMLLMAIVLAVQPIGPAAPLVIAAVFLILTVLGFATGASQLPRAALPRTRKRLERDVTQIRDELQHMRTQP